MSFHQQRLLEPRHIAFSCNFLHSSPSECVCLYVCVCVSVCINLGHAEIDFDKTGEIDSPASGAGVMRTMWMNLHNT